MYAYIIGEVQGFSDGFLLLENQGIGYQIATSAVSMSHFQVGKTYKIHLITAVRDDAILLYGFSSLEEKKMFQLLTKVTSVGAKVAFSILSTLSVEELRRAVLQSDLATLSRAPGVGKKTAGRILLELLDPVEKMGPVTLSDEQMAMPSHEEPTALEALVNLGYARNEAERAIQAVHGRWQSLEELIRLALRELS